MDQKVIEQAKNKIQRLTKRELEIMHYIVAGEQNKNIAYKLGISQRTVENHRLRIMEKTGCNSPSELTCLFLLSVKECLSNCLMTKTCNHTYDDCPIEQVFLKS